MRNDSACAPQVLRVAFRTRSRTPQRTPAVLLLVASLLTGCDSTQPGEDQAAPPAQEAFAAEIIEISFRPWASIVRCQGSLYADEQSIVGTEVAGRVAEVHVDLGDFVSAGDPLVTLDQQDMQLQIDQADAQLRQARSAVGLRDGEPIEKLDPQNAAPVRQEKALWEEAKSVLARSEKLKEQDAIAKGEFELAAAEEKVAEARYAASLNSVREKLALIGVRQAELSLAKQRLQDAVIAAPFDGYVQQRNVALGNYVSVGQSIAIVVRTHPLRFRGMVPERYAQSLQVGQEVRLQIESVADSSVAKITRISPTLDQASRALAFEAEIDNKDHRLRTGLFAEAQVVVDPDALAVVVPDSAVIEFAGTQKVWTVVDGTAAEQEVLTGERRGDSRQILSGLSPGDQVLKFAAEGRVAKVLPKSATDRTVSSAIEGTVAEPASDLDEDAGADESNSPDPASESS